MIEMCNYKYLDQEFDFDTIIPEPRTYEECEPKYRVESAKMLAVSYLFLKGTPFIYQGQEIGMTNMQVNSLDDFIDIETKNVLETMHKLPLTKKYIDKSIKNGSRDNARVPMHWDDTEYAGFSTSKPWLKVNENKSFINVKQSENDPNSILNFYIS